MKAKINLPRIEYLVETIVCTHFQLIYLLFKLVNSISSYVMVGLHQFGERRDSTGSLQRYLSVDEKRSQYLNMNSLSMESGQSSSSKGSDTQDKRGFGGSYSAATGCSSKVIANTLNIGAALELPNLAQVASALMKAKVAGELPSALGNKAVVERVSQAQAGRQPAEPDGQGVPLIEHTNPDVIY